MGVGHIYYILHKCLDYKAQADINYNSLVLC